MLKNIAPNIWIVEGDVVSFFGLPYSTRMTIIRLADGTLWLHSPTKISDALLQQIAALGEVKYLVAPNKIHHLFLNEWLKAFPLASCYAPPGLVKKRTDINFDHELTMAPELEWANQINQTFFNGSPAMQEVVFYHVSSKTLILTDLIENFTPASFNWWQRIVAGITGILAPNGNTNLIK